MRLTLRPLLVVFAVLTVLTGVDLSLGGHRHRKTRLRESSLRQPGAARQTASSAQSLIGQPFQDPKYFWGRLSATSPMPNNAASSGASNFGPTNPALLDAVKARIAQLQIGGSQEPLPIPVDLVTASASGLDPHISPAAALYQVTRVAARGI